MNLSEWYWVGWPILGIALLVYIQWRKLKREGIL